MELKIEEQTETFKSLSLIGRLDTRGVDQIEIKFNAIIGNKAKNVLLDFSEVTFLSSMGIRMLITAARISQRNGGKLVILSPQELVHEAIQNASLDELTPVVNSREEADALFESE